VHTNRVGRDSPPAHGCPQHLRSTRDPSFDVSPLEEKTVSFVVVVLFVYACRSLLARVRTNLVTLVSVGLFVAGGTLGLGFYLTLERMVAGAAPADSIIVLANGATSEIDSAVALETARKVAVWEGVKGEGARRLVARELVTEIQLDEVDAARYEEPIPLRGIDDTSLDVHHATVIAGSPPATGSLQILLGRRVARTHPNLAIGDELLLPAGPCRIVGIFAANGGPHENEVWTLRTALELHTKQQHASSLTMVAASGDRVDDIVNAINTTKELEVRAVPVNAYRAQGAGLGTITWTVLALLALLSVVAISAIATTMNAAVEVRMPELAALAAIGIRRGVLGRLVLVESALLGSVGACVGLLVATVVAMQLGEVAIGTTPVELSPSLAVGAIGAALGILAGVVGGVVPALRVARLDILGALR
jgi:putative ABC transport system permease protein